MLSSTDIPFLRIFEQIGIALDPVPVEDVPLIAFFAQLGITLDPPSESEQESVKRPESMLRSYQRYLADQIVMKPYLLGAAEMSLGKTAATLTGVRRLLRANRKSRCLIIAPLRVAECTWPDEIKEWEHLSDLTCTVIVGSEAQRTAALSVDADLTIMNRENLQWLWKKVGGAVGWRWDILVYDESSRLKGFTKRTKGTKDSPGRLTEFGVLAQARKRLKRVVELSGTPAPNGLIDLGGQAYLLDQGERLGPNKTQFLKKWFYQNQFSYEITPKEHAEEQIMGLMKELMVGLRAQDYIDLPPIHKNIIPVKLPPKLLREYRDFEKTLVAEAYDVEAVSRGVLTNKLLQFANGGLYRQDPEDPDAVRETIEVHDLKLKALESVIEEAAGESVLIAYSFKFDRDRIKKRFPKAVLFDEEPDFVRKWNAGKIRIGAAHPASIGHGLNLQHGGFIQCWYGLNWSLELYDQFNRRLARPGQKNPTVFIHHILAEKTEDFRQFDNLNTKGITQDSITNRVRVKLGLSSIFN